MAENTVGKGGIARDKQFLLFLQCFQKTCIEDMLVWDQRYGGLMHVRKVLTAAETFFMIKSIVRHNGFLWIHN